MIIGLEVISCSAEGMMSYIVEHGRWSLIF